MKKILCFLMLISYGLTIYALPKELSKSEVIAIATDALRAQDFNLTKVQVIYDENNNLWRERVYKMTELKKLPDFKLFERGFMKNYRAVFFGFNNPSGEVWVFIDKDSGEVLEVYRPEFKTRLK